MEKGLSKITPSKQTGLAHDEFYAQLLQLSSFFVRVVQEFTGALSLG